MAKTAAITTIKPLKLIARSHVIANDVKAAIEQQNWSASERPKTIFSLGTFGDGEGTSGNETATLDINFRNDTTQHELFRFEIFPDGDTKEYTLYGKAIFAVGESGIVRIVAVPLVADLNLSDSTPEASITIGAGLMGASEKTVTISLISTSGNVGSNSLTALGLWERRITDLLAPPGPIITKDRVTDNSGNPVITNSGDPVYRT